MHRYNEKYKKSRFELLTEIYEQTGVMPHELECPPVIPQAVVHVWAWFNDLTRTRAAGMGIAAITYAEVGAYFSLTGQVFERWEIELLTAFDAVYLDVMSKEPVEVLHKL